nr:protein rhomboid-like isoform X2 [Onthophagus taurus]
MKIEKDSAHFFTEKYLLKLFNKIVPIDGETITYKQLQDFMQDKDDLILPERVRNVIKTKSDLKGDEKMYLADFIELITNEKYQNRFEKYFNMYMEFLIPPPQPHDVQPPKNLRFHAISARCAIQKQIDDVEIVLEEDEDFEIHERIYRFWPLPLTMILFSLSEIILYLIDASYGLNWRNGIVSKRLIYNPWRRIEIWSIWHLSMNVIFQLLLGSPLEVHYGWWPVSVVYCCGVISGSLGSSVTDSSAWLTGASGGVYALLTAHIVSIIINWKRVNHRKVLVVFLLGFILIDVIRVIIDYLSGNLDHTISHVAHFFGGLSGILIGTVIFKQFSHQGEGKRIVYVLVVISIILIGFGVFYNIFSTFPEPI